MNPLVVDKISKKFLWEKDSGFLYTKQLINSLPKEWRFMILVPDKHKANDFSRFFDYYNHKVEIIPYDYSTSIHQNRYHFNRNILAKALPYSKDIDVVLNMQPEVTANLRVFFENQRREKPIIVNYFHWIDCKESRKFAKDLGGFINRQVEGFNSADISLFHNKYAGSLMQTSTNDANLELDKKASGYFHPQPTKFGMKPIKLPKKKIILFNHRLNNTTGWKEILDACMVLREERSDFVLWFTDEQNLKERGNIDDLDWLEIKSVPFESYGYLLSNAHFSVCNVKDYATWNMAVLDSIHHGTICLAPATPLMDELGCTCTQFMGESIGKLLDCSKIPSKPKNFDDFKLKEYLEREVKRRVENKNPKKYDDVTNMIIERKGWCKKRDFVNEFWSFHANSNFQLIRWKLLTEGYIDQTEHDEAQYKGLNIPII